METQTDEQLVEDYKNGKTEAFEVLVQRYIKPIYNFVYRYAGNRGDSEDITQDTFFNVWKYIKRFDREKKFKTWIFTIAKNTSLNWIKKKKPKLFSEFKNENDDKAPFEEEIEDKSALLEEIFEKANNKERVISMFESLSPNYSLVLLLYYVEELTLQEISDVLSVSINTIKSRHRRGIEKLRKYAPKS